MKKIPSATGQNNLWQQLSANRRQQQVWHWRPVRKVWTQYIHWWTHSHWYSWNHLVCQVFNQPPLVSIFQQVHQLQQNNLFCGLPESRTFVCRMEGNFSCCQSLAEVRRGLHGVSFLATFAFKGKKVFFRKIAHCAVYDVIQCYTILQMG